MSDNLALQEIETTIENCLENVDEERLPLVIAQRLELLEKANEAYEVAKTKEAATREKVQNALIKADALIAESKNVGKYEAEEHQFLWMHWTTKRDEINALKWNLQEIIEHGENSAAAQKELVEVQAALAESQTALLEVQKAQMEYQGHIADAMKFLYGLSAYNMGSVQSVLINLRAVLSGASKEKLGEMAQQQLLLAMDQIKNQESIILRIRENEEIMESMGVEIEDTVLAIEELRKQDMEQDKLIAQNAKTSKENKRLIEASMETDEEQDKLIAQNAETAKENQRLIFESMETDEEQDRLLELQQEKDLVHDQQIQEIQKDIVELKDEAEKLKTALINKGEKKQIYIMMGLGAVATILGILGIIL